MEQDNKKQNRIELVTEPPPTQPQPSKISSADEILQSHASVMQSLGLGGTGAGATLFDTARINQTILLCNINNFAMLTQIAATNAKILELLESQCDTKSKLGTYTELSTPPSTV